MTQRAARRLELTPELQHAYSRGGNFHADEAAARALGLPGLVAQGMQVAGPAFGVLLDAWGDEFLAHGEIELKFVGMVTAGATVEAVMDIDAGEASIEVVELGRARVVIVGTARRTTD